MGAPDDFTNFINAVIDERAFDKISGYIDYAKESKQAEIVVGGKYSKKEGYYISPTVIKANRADFKTMKEEIFGPVLTIYVYSDNRFNQLLETIDNTSPYALTGAIFSEDREVISKVTYALRNAAGNFYICLLYTSPSPRDATLSRMPSSA